MPKNSRQKSKRRERRGEEMTLTDIVRGLQYCVNTSQEIVEQHHIISFGRFFDDNGIPLVKTIKITDCASVDIPMICMSGHSSLILDEMEVKLDLMIKKTAIKQMPCQVADTVMEKRLDLDKAAAFKSKKEDSVTDQNAAEDTEAGNRGARRREYNINRTCFGIDMINGRADREHAHLGISMKFKSCNPPEMISRIIDKLNNAVDVYTTESGIT